MADKGWIKLHRQIQDCWIWTDDDKFDKTHAWIDLLLLANHRDKKIAVDGKPQIITRGQFLTSKNKLADRWNWNVKTVRKFLEILEKDGMIVQEVTNRWTTLTVLNYEVYQDVMVDSTDKSTDNTMADYTADYMVNPMVDYMDTNKNVKNDKEYIKNDKNVKNERNIGEFFPNDELLDLAFKDFVSMRKKIKKPMTDRAIKSMITRLNKLSGGDNDLAIQILDQSTRNCWQDVYELKEDKKGGKTNSREIDWDNV